MNEKMTTNRREALGLASLAVAVATIGAPASASAATGAGKRPTSEELERAKRLYGGELGGRKGAR